MIVRELKSVSPANQVTNRRIMMRRCVICSYSCSAHNRNRVWHRNLLPLQGTNDETRMSNDEIMTNDQMRNNHCYVGSSFGVSNLRHHSSFVIFHPAILSTSLDATISSVRHGSDAA